MSDSLNPTHDEFIKQTIELLDQSMIKLENCLAQLSDEQVWWKPVGGTNSIANQILHMCGNLRQWAIVSLRNEKDERQRDDEFTANGTHSAEELLSELRKIVEQARSTITGTCPSTDGHPLTDKITIQGFDVTVGKAILHTTTHFVGHTHQIILLTRMQLGESYKFAWLSDAERKRLPI